MWSLRATLRHDAVVTGHMVAPPIMHLKAVKDNRRTNFLLRTLACHSGLRKLWTMSNKGYVWSSFDKINENEVQCKLSRTRLAYHRSSTAMHNHLRAKHPGGPSTGQQQSVASFMIRTTKSDANVKRAEQTTAHITEMIAKYMLPISFVEGEGFKTYGFCKARVYLSRLGKNDHCQTGETFWWQCKRAASVPSC